MVRFYTEGLGLVELARFEEHAGFSGVTLGLLGAAYHLEFTSHRDGSPGLAPTPENLLVLYLGNAETVEAVNRRLAALDHHSVAAENPYWPDRGAVTIEDPDGWRVVLMPAPAF